MTPLRPMTGGVQSPSGPPVAYGPSPVTQQYRHSLDLSVPPVQWGNQEECEDGVQDLFQGPIGPRGFKEDNRAPPSMVSKAPWSQITRRKVT